MRYLIVDGHSIIFQWPELRAMHGRRGGAARDELIRWLTQYQDATDIRVVVVFDGRSDRQNEATEPGGIQVFYSKDGQTADAIIERLCAKYANQHDIVVATDDNMERQTAMTFGASTVSSDMLRTLIKDADKDLRRRIEKHRKG